LEIYLQWHGPFVPLCQRKETKKKANIQHRVEWKVTKKGIDEENWMDAKERKSDFLKKRKSTGTKRTTTFCEVKMKEKRYTINDEEGGYGCAMTNIYKTQNKKNKIKIAVPP
jgi:hypothetical protein